MLTPMYFTRNLAIDAAKDQAVIYSGLKSKDLFNWKVIDIPVDCACGISKGVSLQIVDSNGKLNVDFAAGAAGICQNCGSSEGLTFDVVFHKDDEKDYQNLADDFFQCKLWIETYNGSKQDAFNKESDWNVSIFCNQTKEFVFTEAVK